MNVDAASGTDGASGTGNRTAARRVRKQPSSGALPGQFPGTSGYRGAGDLMCRKCHMERLWQPIRRAGSAAAVGGLDLADVDVAGPVGRVQVGAGDRIAAGRRRAVV